METNSLTYKEQQQLEIIKAAMKDQGVKQDVIGDLLGIERSGVSKLLSGKRQMKAKELVRIALRLKLDVPALLAGISTSEAFDYKTYGDIDWENIGDENVDLLSEEVDEYLEEDRQSAKARTGSFIDGVFLTKTKIKGAIPEIDVLVGAGEGELGEVVSFALGGETYSGHPVTAEWMLPENYAVHELHINRGRSLIMKVIGDSMAPTYGPGDRVIIDLKQNVMTVDGVYVISDGESPPQIKRLQRILFSTPVQVDVVSDNPSHSVQRVDMERLRIIGRVAGRVSAA